MSPNWVSTWLSAFFSAILIGGSSVQAQVQQGWSTTNQVDDYNTPADWIGGIVPAASGSIIYLYNISPNPASQTINFSSNDTYSVDQLYMGSYANGVGFGGGNNTFNMIGGSLMLTDTGGGNNFSIGGNSSVTAQSDHTTNLFNMTGGDLTASTATGNFLVGMAQYSVATVNFNGGAATFGASTATDGQLLIGGNGSGTVNIDGGNVTLSQTTGGCIIGAGRLTNAVGNGTLNMISGVLNVMAGANSRIHIGHLCNNSLLNVSGGTINATGILFGDGLSSALLTNSFIVTGGQINVGPGGIGLSASSSADINKTLISGGVFSTLSGNWTWSNAIPVTTDSGTITFAPLAGTSITLSCVISGPAALNCAGPGLMVLNAADSFTGGVTVNGGALAIAAAQTNVFGLSIAPGGNGNLQINNANNALVDNPISLPGGSTLIFSNTVPISFPNTVNGAGNLLVGGIGGVINSGNLNYTGNTYIDAGTLFLVGAGPATATTTAIGAGGTLDVSLLTANNYTFGGSSFTASGIGAGSAAAAINGGDGTTIIRFPPALPLTFNFSPVNTTGDALHPALYIPEGTVSLGGNTITVNNNGSALGFGAYVLIQQAVGNIASTDGFTLSPVAGGGIVADGVASLSVIGGTLSLVVTPNDTDPYFSNLTPFPAVAYGATNITLTGTVSNLTGGVAASNDTINVSINGNPQAATAIDTAGDFSCSYTLDPALSPGVYAISCSYTGALGGATDTSTALTVNAAPTLYWDPEGVTPQSSPSGNWEDMAWIVTPTVSTNEVSWVEGAIASFAPDSSATGAYAVTANSSHTIAGLYNGALGGNSASVGLTINGGVGVTLTLQSNNVLPTAVFDTGSGGLTTINAALAGPGQLLCQGNGTLVLNGANTYSGGTIVSQGVLSVSAISDTDVSGIGNSGPGNSNNFILNGGTLQYTGTNAAPTAREFFAAGTASIIDLPNAGSLTLGNRIASLAGSPIISLTGNGTLTLGGTDDNNGLGMNVGPGATLVLDKNPSATNVHSLGGTTTTVRGGTIQVAGPGGYQIYSTAVTIVTNNGVLDMDGQNDSFSTLSLAGAGNQSGFLSGALINSATNTTSLLTNGGNGVLLAGNASIGGAGNLTLYGAVNGPGSLTYDGSGVLTLNAVNTYTGGTTINAGSTLTISGAGSLGRGNYAGSITNNCAFVNLSTASPTISGVISGTGALTQAGAGTLTLAASNTYTGATTVSNASTLALGAGGSIAFSSTVVVQTNATLANLITAGVTVVGGPLTFQGASTSPPEAAATNLFTASGGIGSSSVGQIMVSGDLILNTTPITIKVAGSAPLAPGSYTLMNCTGMLSGAASPTPKIAGVPLTNGSIATINTIAGSGGHVDLVISRPIPSITGVTAAPAITYGASNVTLSGTVSAGSLYPPNGESGTISATINGHTVTGTFGNSGAFTIIYNDPSLPTTGIAGSPYPITYAYSGNGDFNASSNNTATSLKVNPASLTIIANPESKTYGQLLDFGAGSTAFINTALSNNETIGSVTLVCSGGPANAPVSGSPYAITPSLATGGTFNSVNYAITYNPGSLTVSPLPAVLTGVRPYDTNNDASYAILSVSNIIDGDNVTVASGAGTLLSSNVAAEPIQSFGTLALGGASAGNYVLGSPGGSVLVTVAPFSITSEQLDGAGNIIINWQASPGGSYQVVGTTNLTNALKTWPSVGGPVVAGNYVTNLSATNATNAFVKFYSVTNGAGD